jgi:hypothetical protein
MRMPSDTHPASDAASNSAHKRVTMFIRRLRKLIGSIRRLSKT